MYTAKNGAWPEGLREVLRRVYDPTTRVPVPWLLSGDAALALQGVTIEPDTIEFRATSAVATAYFAQFMRPHELPVHRAVVVYRRGSNVAPSEGWRSNIHQRVVAWSVGGKATWLGRWQVDERLVQVSYVRSIHADPTALAFRAPIRRVPFDGMEVAVVPLEFLLAESALRNDTQLTHRILHAMRTRGYSQADLETALGVLPSEKASRLSRLVEFSLVAG
jgi:hypothetical protein